MRKISLLLITLLFSLHLCGQDDIEVINIENKAVQDYMADAWKTYNESNYNVSVITKYNDSNTYGTKLYWPQGKEVRWTPTTTAANIKEIRITASENSDYSNGYTFNPDEKSVSSYIIRNLLPNCTYYYKVEEFLYDGTVNEKASGVFRTVGQVRMIQIRNCANIRDIGGWPTQYGVPIKYGKLFRSASLDRITANGKHDFINNLGVLAELDLRHETNRTTSALGADKDYLRLNHSGYLPGMKGKNLVYVNDLRWILSRLMEGKNVDWHCAIGCDRCGTVSFLIEGLLGMYELDLCRDYELSTLSLGRNNKRTRGSLKGMINFIKNYGPDNDLKQCFYNYWRSIGMNKDELDYFIYLMLDISNIAEITEHYSSQRTNN